MENDIEGSCHCGVVRFKLEKKPKLIVNCHCDDCKKRNGSAFSTYLAVSENKLSFTNGHEQLKQYENESEGIKYFCAQCGSPIYNKNYRYPGIFMVFYGALSNPSDFKPSFNVFCENKLKWVDSLSNIKGFKESIVR